MAAAKSVHPSAKSGRPKGADSGARRDHILNCSIDLFVDRGYHGVSMSMVARESGLSPTGLAHYFSDKDELLTEILRRRDVIDTSNWLAANDGANGSGWERITALTGLVRHNESQQQLMRLFTTMASEATNPDHPARQWLLEHHHQTMDTIRQACQEAKKDGVLRADAPEDLIARVLVSCLDGLQLQYLSDDSMTSMAESFDLLSGALFERYKA
ncbi:MULTISPECIES: TetR/AcrR family transcriptional regulator [Glutamicibacter]|uniref:TetR/AcrR family transcriptional regulator n=1 Tax=Glutamicibacter halophytocola TaxID=1933880 RepID=A0AA94Y0X9_9MICC|nr:TetR/AcrR family transcriptional regulator [Glutamicibacter halophytocola]MBF6672266.1 TetR/AcrR family transcriptional regulator [Glutamicibacter sp. FBE19]UUX60278.1 TetR/AcrR family transcriptional regulator [Glutamicibacter halophytocola]